MNIKTLQKKTSIVFNLLLHYIQIVLFIAFIIGLFFIAIYLLSTDISTEIMEDFISRFNLLFIMKTIIGVSFLTVCEYALRTFWNTLAK